MPNKILSLLMLAGCAASLSAAEYFVAPDGDDARDGKNVKNAFASVQRGVDALAPGDTLTIMPGEYYGPVFREGLGRPADDSVQTTAPLTRIRARIPGTVVLRGDMPAPSFSPVPGMRFVYVADLDGAVEVQAVNELDTLKVLPRMLNPVELEFNPGAYHQDRAAGKLYLSTTDLRPPAAHHYSLSITPRHGLYLVKPLHVEISGLAVGGFNTAAQLHHGERTHGAVFGIFLVEGENCVVRDCVAYFNGRGIGMNSRSTGGNNLIESCTAWANSGIGGGGALTIFEPNQDRIARSTAYMNGRLGILLYIGNNDGFGHVYRSLSWGNAADFQLKAGRNNLAERSVGVGGWAQDARSRRAENCLIGHIREPGEGYRDNIILSGYDDLEMDVDFADPANHDYRLQATSRFRNAASDGGDLGPFDYGANIYFVAVDGDDAADGLSMAAAWATLDQALGRLQPGDTLYIAPGVYRAGTRLRLPADADAPVAIRGRGHAPVFIDGVLEITGGRQVQLARLNFRDGLALKDIAAVAVENCRFLGGQESLRAALASGLRVEHCQFTGYAVAGIVLRESDKVFLAGNLFDNRTAPAVWLDREDALLYSDYNAYAGAEFIMAIEGRALAMGAMPERLERHARVVTPEWREREGVPVPDNRHAYAIAGPWGTPAGVYNPAADFKHDDLLLAGPFVHSVDAATVNIEWWTSARPNGLAVAWGPPGAPGEFEKIESDLAGSFSLSGLQPAAAYEVLLVFDQPVTVLELPDTVKRAGDTFSIRFVTAPAQAAPREYYVAPDGDDAADGLSRASAWRTVNQAADRVRPGDTVKLAGGIYHESVRLRATGDAGRPITFTVVPGEKVVFDGYMRNLKHAFYAADKAHLRIDGFYFTDMGRGGTTPWSSSGNGAVNLYRCRDVALTRCFMDGRGAGPYSPGLLQANHCADIRVQNCVIFRTMGGGIGVAGSPDTRIENTVFLRNFISHISEVVNTSDQPVIIRDNIFTDSLPGKRNSALWSIGRVESLAEDNNCFHFRQPMADRPAIMLYDNVAYERAALAYGVAFEPGGPSAVAELTHIPFPEYQRRFNPGSTSFEADPLFAGSLGLPRVDEDGQPLYVIDRFVGMLQRDDVRLEFDNLFATNPEVVERGAGLQPEVFADFHFHGDAAARERD